jgi:hypothetical protein
VGVRSQDDDNESSPWCVGLGDKHRTEEETTEGEWPESVLLQHFQQSVCRYLLGRFVAQEVGAAAI